MHLLVFESYLLAFVFSFLVINIILRLLRKHFFNKRQFELISSNIFDGLLFELYSIVCARCRRIDDDDDEEDDLLDFLICIFPFNPLESNNFSSLFVAQLEKAGAL